MSEILNVKEVKDNIFAVRCSVDLSREKLEYLTKNDTVTTLVLTKNHGKVVSSFIGVPDDSEASLLCNKEPIETAIHWEETYKEVKNIHENTMDWVRKKQEKAR